MNEETSVVHDDHDICNIKRNTKWKSEVLESTVQNCQLKMFSWENSLKELMF